MMIWMALSDSQPKAFKEITGDGYERVEITDAIKGPHVPHWKINEVDPDWPVYIDIEFPLVRMTWAEGRPIQSWAVFDAAIGGKLILCGPVEGRQVLDTGCTPLFRIEATVAREIEQKAASMENS